MDIIRRKPISRPQPSLQPVQEPARPQLPFKEREELYITQEDVASVLAVEKKYQRGRKLKRLFKTCLVILLLLLLALGFFFAWKTYAVSKKISANPTRPTSFSTDMKSVLATLLPSKKRQPLKGETGGRINILLLGAAGEKKPGKNLTDTIMLLSIDTKNGKLAMLSLPRDLYVKTPDDSFYTKINGLYQRGLAMNAGASQVKQVVEEITGVPIQYYLVADFEGFEKLINDIGGVNVTVERDIYDARYPGPNYSYQTFELKKGFHTLDGATALKYVRERHDDPQGDFGRAKRQQQVIQAVKNKVFSAQTLLNVVTLNNLLNTVGDNIKTDISLEEIEGFLALAKQVDTQNINNVVVDAWQKDSLLKVSHVQVGPTRAFILVPRVGNYSEVQEVASTIFDRQALEKRRAQIASEEASIVIINESGDYALATKMRQLLVDKLGLKNVKVQEGTNQAQREQTVVIDNAANKKIYTLDELLKKIPATLSTESDPMEASQPSDLVVLLGKDAAQTYRYEEDTIEDLQSADDNQLPLEIMNAQ